MLLQSADCIVEAAALYDRLPADFLDCLLAPKARKLGCEALRSFGKKMNVRPGVVLL